MTGEKMRRLDIAGTVLQFYDVGAGAPLLYLHGALGLEKAPALIRALSASRRVIAPCHPGFGLADLPDWLETADDIANIHLGLLDALGLHQVDLVGSSLGGWIGAEMASWSPERFRRIVLVSPVGVKVGTVDRLDVPDLFAMPPAELDRLFYFAPSQHAFDPVQYDDDALTSHVRNRETLALLSWEPYMHNPKLRHRLHRVVAPICLLRGERDGVVSADYLNAYAALFAKGSTGTIARAGHVPELEQPEALASAILSFFADEKT